MNNNNVNHQPTRIAVIGIVALWFLFALTMSITGGYVARPDKPPLVLGLAVAVPIIGFVAAYLRRGSLWAFAQTLDLRLVTLAHIGRLLGFGFLVSYWQGLLPGGFALPAGIGDVSVALAATPMALALARRAPGVKARFVSWNIFGIADLVVAVGSGILHSASAFGILVGNGPTTALMSEFPRAMVPTFLVPLYILLHLLALARAREVEESPRATGGRASLTPA